jgi:hypothetical protein
MNRRKLLLAGAGLTFGAVAGSRSQDRESSAPAGPSKTPVDPSVPLPPTEPLGAVWSRRLPGTVGVTVAPDGSRVFAVTESGGLVCFDERGEVLWERDLPGVDTLAAGRRGTLLLAYAARQPLNRRLHFLDRTGGTLRTLELPEAIETAVVSANGDRAVAACGRTLAFFSRDMAGIHSRLASAEGEPRQLQLAPGDTVYAAFAGGGGVCRVKSNGRVLWRQPQVSGALPSISASQSGQLLAIASDANPAMLRIVLVDARRDVKWSIALPGRDGRVRTSARGNAVLLAYEHPSVHSIRTRFERRLAYLSGGEAPVWVAGGAFNAPLDVAIDPEGQWVVALEIEDGYHPPVFRLRDSTSRAPLWGYTCPRPLLLAAPAAEGQSIAIYRDDARLSLLRVNQE